MKSRYRIIARRRVEAPRLGHRDRRAAFEPVLDDPFDMPSELVDLATGELAVAGLASPQKKRGS